VVHVRYQWRTVITRYGTRTNRGGQHRCTASTFTPIDGRNVNADCRFGPFTDSGCHYLLPAGDYIVSGGYLYVLYHTRIPDCTLCFVPRRWRCERRLGPTVVESDRISRLPARLVDDRVGRDTDRVEASTSRSRGGLEVFRIALIIILLLLHIFFSLSAYHRASQRHPYNTLL